MTVKKKILFVEDEESTRNALRIKLEDAGFEVLLAEDGEKGLQMAQEYTPDLILSDVIMPKMHGIDMLNALRNEKWGENIPIIVLTNYADDPRVIDAEKKKKCIVMNKSNTKLSDVINKVAQEFKNNNG